MSSCSSDSSDSAVLSDTDNSNNTGDTDDYTGNSFRLDYTFGTYSGGNDNIYVIWAENPDEAFYYPIYVCERLLGKGEGPLTGTALPYWKVNKYPEMDSTEIDAVTHPTIDKDDFSVLFNLADDAPDLFTVYFETDVYYNDNEWFKENQPATLYKAEIDRNNMQDEYILEFIGWTPNEANVSNEKNYNYITSIELDFGSLQSETRYINNLKVSSFPDVFGGADDNPQTNLVDSIIVTPVSME